MGISDAQLTLGIISGVASVLMFRLDRLGKQLEAMGAMIRADLARTEEERSEILQEWKETKKQAAKMSGSSGCSGSSSSRLLGCTSTTSGDRFRWKTTTMPRISWTIYDAVTVRAVARAAGSRCLLPAVVGDAVAVVVVGRDDAMRGDGWRW
jgi:hexokinase